MGARAPAPLLRRTDAGPPEALARLGAIAACHHERLDGSGYHRSLPGSALSPSARILAAADAYHAMTEARPHRGAEPEQAAATLRGEVRAGRIDADAAEDVLTAAGHCRRRSRARAPAGLTARELEVLLLVARGSSSRDVAQKLTIAEKTAATTSSTSTPSSTSPPVPRRRSMRCVTDSSTRPSQVEANASRHASDRGLRSLHAAFTKPKSNEPLGPIGRLGRLSAKHRGRVFVAWALIAVGLGILAPRVRRRSPAPAGRRTARSRSRPASKSIATSPAPAATRCRWSSTRGTSWRPRRVPGDGGAFAADSAARSRRAPGRTAGAGPISPDGHTAVIRAGAGADPNAMVDAADRLKTRLADAARPGVAVSLTGAPGMWSDFNQANREAMLKSEFISWPLTMAILVLAFGSLVAAGLPLMLTITGLIASAGLLFLGTLISPISIWAMNFALMFALALGIDYALFIVMRFRGAHFGQGSVR